MTEASNRGVDRVDACEFVERDRSVERFLGVRTNGFPRVFVPNWASRCHRVGAAIQRTELFLAGHFGIRAAPE